MESSLTVIILGAGLGTRMKSKTAKVLHRAGGLTLIEHVVRAARAVAPAERILVVIGHQAETVRQVLDSSGVRFVVQEEQLGTGHAVMKCRDAAPPDGLTAILYGDAPLLSAETLGRLVDAHRSRKAAATVLTTELDDPSGYGRILRDDAGQVAAIVEHRAATEEIRRIREINSGIYCFSSELLWRYLGRIGTDNPVGEYYLTDIVGILRQAGHPVVPLLLENPEELLGINTRQELAEVDRILRQRTARRLMLEGVTIEKPETVLIDPDVTVGADTILEPFVRLRGETAIGSDCRVGACSLIEDSALADGVVVEPFTLIVSSKVQSGARIGPYARLRPGTVVEAGAHIGNFVELKKTRLGKGSKANHMAYLGDSEIGENVNVGAGTITCNYDGIHKHQTVIRDGAFIGSNATLVAPVEVGAGSYVGAGSVITERVPEDALALGRSRQVTKDGWAAKRRPKP